MEGGKPVGRVCDGLSQGTSCVLILSRTQTRARLAGSARLPVSVDPGTGHGLCISKWLGEGEKKSAWCLWKCLKLECQCP